MARVLPASAGAGAVAQEVRVPSVGGSRLASRVRLWSSLCEGQVPLSVCLQPLQQQKCGGRDLVSIRVSKASIVVTWGAVGMGGGEILSASGASRPPLPWEATPPQLHPHPLPAGTAAFPTLLPPSLTKAAEWDFVRTSVQTFVGSAGAH